MRDATPHRVQQTTRLSGPSAGESPALRASEARESSVADATAYRAAKPWLDDGDLQLYHGDVLTILQSLPSGIAQTCVTSPPYWGLRDYGTGTWSGGDPACDHQRPPNAKDEKSTLGTPGHMPGANTHQNHAREPWPSGLCGKCGAQRVDDQLGLEPTPTLYVERMVEVFREVGRVLRADGTLWLNIGDSYAGGGGFAPEAPVNVARREAMERGERVSGSFHLNERQHVRNKKGGVPVGNGLKPKDLVGIPWRLAFALQADGWYLRSDIIWSKPNPMPESVTDRPTKAHEYVFLFSKQPRYFYDADAVREDAIHAGREITLGPKSLSRGQQTGAGYEGHWGNGAKDSVTVAAGRNLRSVWQIATQPFPEAHFATYPEELVRRCILAGTSERGGCAECGAPWRRIVERTPYEPPIVSEGERFVDQSRQDKTRKLNGKSKEWRDSAASALTTGWEPSCFCGGWHDGRPAATAPQLVLDPFIGSGTTALVARKHGRHAIGIDLSAEYLAIAARRTSQLSLLGAAR